MNKRVVVFSTALVILVAGAIADFRFGAQPPVTPIARTTAQPPTQPAQSPVPAEAAKTVTPATPAPAENSATAAPQPTPEKAAQATQPAPAEKSPQAATPAIVASPPAPPAQTVAPLPAETKAPAIAQAPAKAAVPLVNAPSAPPSAPVIAALPTETKKPAVEPPAKAAVPLVDAPAASPPAPAIAALPTETQSTAAIEAPASVEPAPVITAAPESKPQTTPETKAAVAPPSAPTPEITVEAPMPPVRPEISQVGVERTTPAKTLFSEAKLPSAGPPRAIGYYPRGCLGGGVELPVNGATWQVMRLSRNRNWGHPELLHFLERFAPAASKATGWPGILIGDMAQPRGGPLPYGHASHQIGLDVDIWYRPMPDYRLSREQRETWSATSLVAKDREHLNPQTWSSADAAFIRTAAEQPNVERIFVNAVIKKELCRLEGKHHWSWLEKVRPWYGHDDHMHIRLKCPADSPHCRHQPPVPAGDGCSKQALAFWFTDRVLHPKPPKHPPKPRKPIMMADLPGACMAVLNAPAKRSRLAADGE